MSEERDTTVDEAPETVEEAAPEQAAPAPADGGGARAAGAEAEDEALRAQDAAAEPEAEPEEPDYKDLYLRAAAEADNVRKRARRDVDAAQARGVARLARELLPALDNLDRALAHAEAEEADANAAYAAGTGEEHHLTKGIRLVQQELLAALTRVGIEPYSPVGEEFDPHVHEAVAQQPAPDGAKSGTVIQVYQQGYRYKDEVLRAAKVVVAG